MTRKALSLRPLQTVVRRHAGFIRRLETLYAEMDAHYGVVAAWQDFECRGCDDNCCRTRFDHHTLVEVTGLYQGYLALPHEVQSRVARRAHAYCRAMPTTTPHGQPFRCMCPLNEDARCLLYAQRPMICRLHGIPHALRHPRKGLITGTGCHIFESSCRKKEVKRLDRTPLYRAMAALEGELRRATDFREVVRLTVAEMIVRFEKAP